MYTLLSHLLPVAQAFGISLLIQATWTQVQIVSQTPPPQIHYWFVDVTDSKGLMALLSKVYTKQSQKKKKKKKKKTQKKERKKKQVHGKFPLMRLSVTVSSHQLQKMYIKNWNKC